MDMGDYFCIPADESDLNYAKYFSDGNRDIGTLQEYNSSNTHRLSPEELKETLSGCSYVANELKEWNHL